MSGECEKCGEHTLECTCRARPTMKTAREIIAGAVRSGRACEGEYPCAFCSWSPDDLTKNFDETGCNWIADAILAALAAEGFSIVETEPNVDAALPVYFKEMPAIGYVEAVGGYLGVPLDEMRADMRAAVLASRSTRKGKTE